uniref:Na_Ca_ex domain-containing protein n=1 Tax=Macrostomum lignano TaxID=282301 RepID=A0A1I8I030_9PLAT
SRKTPLQAVCTKPDAIGSDPTLWVDRVDSLKNRVCIKKMKKTHGQESGFMQIAFIVRTEAGSSIFILPIAKQTARHRHQRRVLSRLGFSTVVMATIKKLTRRQRRWRTAAATAVATVASVGVTGWFAVAMAIDGLATARLAGGDGSLEAATSLGSRHLLSLPQLAPSNACTPRSIENFPPDLFSLADKRRGAVALHGLAALWLFAGLAIVCDDYFVASLEVLCEVLHLKPDVAGATFMAAGSSAPELFTSVIGVFLTQSDVGVSTIVGSAVFNLLFIVSLCGLFATQIIFLSWWPIVRDCSYYSLSVVSLILVIYDEKVHWYEAAALLMLYAMYIVIMYFNESIDQWIAERWPNLATGGNQRLRKAGGPAAKATAASSNGSHRGGPAAASGLVSLQDFGPPAAKRSAMSGKTGAAYWHLRDLEDEQAEELDDSDFAAGNSSSEVMRPLLDGCSSSPSAAAATAVQMTEVDLQQPADGMGIEVSAVSQRVAPSSVLVRHVAMDAAVHGNHSGLSEAGRWRQMFFLTLLNSILWIGGMSYLLVWMVCTIGDTLGIPDTVMGLTILAAGTSVPDALASVFVARDGFGDMAVSNSVGSNVFDILLGLGLPWFIGAAVRSSPGGAVSISSAGLTYSSVVLLSTVLLLLTSVYANKMKLDKKLGLACLLLYLLFITVSVLFETNVFAQLNPPPCARKQ